MYKQKRFLVFFVFLVCSFSRTYSQIVLTPTSGCAPLSVQMSGPAGATSIHWNLGSGMGTSALSNPNPIYTIPGTYNITYTAIVGGNPVSYNAQLFVQAGPNGSFSYSMPQSHCAPMTVTFTGTGGGAGSTYYWSFGDLSPVISGTNVTHTYNFSNNFNPILTIAVLGCTVVASPASGGTISVSNPPNPIVNSSDGFVGCTPPFTTSINGSNSTSGSPTGGGLTFNWSFNTGVPASSTAGNPGLVTFGQGYHNIVLQLTDNNQCSKSISIPVTVVNPSLTATVPGTVCLNAPVPATIQTSATNVMVYNSGTMSAVNLNATPNITFTVDTLCKFSTPGVHQLTFVVQGAPGCPSFTLQKTVFVEQVIASFTLGPLPHSTCDSVLVTSYLNQSSTNTGASMTFSWWPSWPPNSMNYGTPTLAVLNNMSSPSFTFHQGSLNPYTVYNYFIPTITLYAQSNSAAQCKASILYDYFDTIVRPTAWFKVDKRSGCAPLTVKFTDTSFFSAHYPASPLNYTWCNGATPPVFVVGGLITSFTYTSPGTYYPYLIIETAGGCRDKSFVDTITVVNPPTVSAVYPATVCAGFPFTFNLSGTATAVPSSTAIDHWHVDTDVGYFSGCTTNPNPTFSLTHVGVHNVTVTASQAACESKSVMPQTITVKGPYGRFRYETNCHINRKSVNFEVHLQEVETATLNFGDLSQIILTGNQVGVTSTVITHTYSASSNYTVKLSSRNSANPMCGTNVHTQTVVVRDATARITLNNQPVTPPPQAIVCTKSPLPMFTGTTSADAYAGCAKTGYQWFFRTPTYNLPPAEIGDPFFHSTLLNGVVVGMADQIGLDTLRSVGIHTLVLMVTDQNSCVDFDTVTFRVGAAVPSFSFSSNPICLSNGSFQIVNTTQANQHSLDVISSYTWDYGDGSISTSTNPLDNPVHTYANAASPSQIFTIMCIASNTLGCTDTTRSTLQVNNPLPGFYSPNAYPCLKAGQPALVNFVAVQGYATYSVTYGDSQPPVWYTSSSYNNASYPYSTPGVYSSTMVIVDSDGCTSKQSINIMASGQPTAVIKFPPDGKNRFCLEEAVNVFMQSDSKANVTPVTQYQWQIGPIMSAPSAVDNISNSFTVGITTVSLTVYVTVLGSPACPHTTSAQVIVSNPSAEMEIKPKVLCLGDTLEATVKNANADVKKWQWFFGDFVNQPALYPPFGPNTVNYPYNIFPSASADGTVMVTLYYFADLDPQGCRKIDTTTIRVIKLESDFTQLDNLYAHCLRIPDTFTASTGNYPGLNLSYTWDFGDQSTGSGIPASHTYTGAGTYSVTLKVEDATYGCPASSSKQMIIFPLPTASISITQSLSCPGATFEVKGAGLPGGSGALTGTLNPGNEIFNMAPSNSFVAVASTSVETAYVLQVTDNNGCISDPVLDSIYVQAPAPSINWDTTVVIGQTVQLNAYVGPGYNYTWSPVITDLDCDTCLLPNPTSSSTVNVTYTVLVEDFMRCSIVKNRYNIIIEPKVSLDVPTAFTPNGDGVNDIIFPDGWGIRKLIYFKVFNRWGQLLFETNDIKVGWNGLFNGTPQNVETYVYQVSVETFLDREPVLSKTGTFKLLR